jgi:hypothetical protein
LATLFAGVAALATFAVGAGLDFVDFLAVAMMFFYLFSRQNQFSVASDCRKVGLPLTAQPDSPLNMAARIDFDTELANWRLEAAIALQVCLRAWTTCAGSSTRKTSPF